MPRRFTYAPIEQTLPAFNLIGTASTRSGGRVISGTVNANVRVNVVGRVVNTHGDVLANDEADLWDGTIAAGVNYNEFGNLLSNNTLFWTGSNQFGVASGAANNWSSTLTVIKLGLPELLQRTLATTNPVESAPSVAGKVTGCMNRWRDGDMRLRWCTAGLLRAEEPFRRVEGYKQIHLLAAAPSTNSTNPLTHKRKPLEIDPGVAAIFNQARDNARRSLSAVLISSYLREKPIMPLAAKVAAILVALLSFNVAVFCDAESGPVSHEVGLAKVDITPDYNIRLSGFASRQTESVGVRERIFAGPGNSRHCRQGARRTGRGRKHRHTDVYSR